MTINITRFFPASPRLRVSASLIFLLLLFQIPALAQSALERVRQSGELRVGTDATSPPFETAEGGQFTGFDIDLITSIARELGARPVFINSGFDGIFPALQN